MAILITALQILLYQLGYASVAVWISFLHYTLALATVFEYCAACAVFFLLMVLKIVPDNICDDCRIDFVIEEDSSPTISPQVSNQDEAQKSSKREDLVSSISNEFDSGAVVID